MTKPPTRAVAGVIPALKRIASMGMIRIERVRESAPKGGKSGLYVELAVRGVEPTKYQIQEIVARRVIDAGYDPEGRAFIGVGTPETAATPRIIPVYFYDKLDLKRPGKANRLGRFTRIPMADAILV